MPLILAAVQAGLCHEKRPCGDGQNAALISFRAQQVGEFLGLHLHQWNLTFAEDEKLYFCIASSSFLVSFVGDDLLSPRFNVGEKDGF